VHLSRSQERVILILIWNVVAAPKTLGGAETDRGTQLNMNSHHHEDDLFSASSSLDLLFLEEEVCTVARSWPLPAGPPQVPLAL